MDRDKSHDPKEARPDDTVDRPAHGGDATGHDAIAPNPPRTTKGGITAPKFGSAGSGGAELDPGPERD